MNNNRRKTRMKKFVLSTLLLALGAVGVANYVSTAQAYSCYTQCTTYGNSTQCTRNCY
jgi:hypothetical protein